MTRTFRTLLSGGELFGVGARAAGGSLYDAALRRSALDGNVSRVWLHERVGMPTRMRMGGSSWAALHSLRAQHRSEDVMAVYVDKLQNWPQPPKKGAERWFGNGKPSCHLTADTLAELHAFSRRLHLRFDWFQSEHGGHYDLTPGKRAEAVRLGAREGRSEATAKEPDVELPSGWELLLVDWSPVSLFTGWWARNQALGLSTSVYVETGKAPRSHRFQADDPREAAAQAARDLDQARREWDAAPLAFRRRLLEKAQESNTPIDEPLELPAAPAEHEGQLSFEVLL